MITPLHAIALDWAIRDSGIDHVTNLGVRSLRFAEEAVELAQANGVPKEKMLDLVGIVYDRPPGDPLQEMGGVMMTFIILCAAAGADPDAVFLRELRRVLDKPPAHFADRNKAKVDMGLS